MSGASAYRKGEFLYQDFLYDDYGADGGGDKTYGRRGTYLYPTDPKYAGNAADVVEVRLKPLADATAVRITYNTMHDPELVATTIALGTSAIPYDIPHGANARAPAEVFVTAHGSVADVVDAATGSRLTAVKPSVSVSLERRQVDVRIPYAAFDPRGRTVRVAAASGLWDGANDRYLVPRPGAADATHPGGAGTLTPPTAFFNVAFRYTEPAWGLQDNLEPLTHSLWREQQQAADLATRDLSRFFANVDFTKLARHKDDDMRGQPEGVPETGFMSRILVSHFETAQGRGNAVSLAPSDCAEQPCIPDLAGRLQPYGLYVPTKSPAASCYGLTIDLHVSTENYNASSETQRAKQLGERGHGSIVVTPGGRGPDYWYVGQSAADIFEAWADIAARYHVDSDNVIISGGSMGSYGAHKFAALFPDLFAATVPVTPCPYDPVIVPDLVDWAILPLVPSYRHVPVFSWNMVEDEFCPYSGAQAIGDELSARGYRHEFLSVTGGHIDGWSAALSNFSEVTDWLGDRRVVRDPAHVTYVFNEFMNEPEIGVNADHAYWISDLRIRDEHVTPAIGTIDVFSHGFGVGDPPALPATFREGTLNTTPPKSFVRESHELGEALPIPQRNRLDIKVENIRALTIDPQRARVGCNAHLNVETDGYVEITLRGCDRKVVYGGNS